MKNKKSKFSLPKMEYFLSKKHRKNIFICIIQNNFMLIVIVKKQQVGVTCSFDKSEIRKIKQKKYPKISLETGLEYTLKVGERICGTLDEKTIMGAEILVKELFRFALQQSMKKERENANSCHGG